jgi:O-antigen/teichoic acid export membrane protein
MSASRNVLAGLVNTAWFAVASFAVVPFYLRYLGTPAYGLIGFYLSLQGLLMLLDLGLMPAVSREVAARKVDSKASQSLGNLLHSVALLYWGIASLLLLGLWVCAGTIANWWLDFSALPQVDSVQVVMLMGATIAFRFPHGIYRAALIGTQQLVRLYAINMLIIGLSYFGAVLVLAFVSSTIEAFFLWQLLCSICLTLLMRRAAWKAINAGPAKNSSKPGFDAAEVRKIWHFSAWMAVVSAASIILLQMDKLILSKLLPLEDYAVYMIAVFVGSALAGIFMPVFNVIYPRMTAAYSSGDSENFQQLYRSSTRLLASILLPIALLLSVFGESLIAWWTGDITLAERAMPMMRLIAVGYAINGVMSAPYAALLAYGRSDLAALIIGSLAVLIIPLLLILTGNYGGLGGALSWFIIQLLYLIFGGWLTHRLVIQQPLSWLSFDVGIPLFAALLIGSLAWLYTDNDAGVWVSLLSMISSGLAMLALTAGLYALLIPGFKTQMRQYFSG